MIEHVVVAGPASEVLAARVLPVEQAKKGGLSIRPSKKGVLNICPSKREDRSGVLL